MTWHNFIGDIEDGNFSHAIERIEDYFSTLPPYVQSFLTKAGTQEYNILKTLIPIAVKDVVSGGFTTASFVAAGTDVLAQLIAQNITTFTMQDIMADLNMAVSVVAPVGTVLPSTADTVAAVDAPKAS